MTIQGTLRPKLGLSLVVSSVACTKKIGMLKTMLMRFRMNLKKANLMAIRIRMNKRRMILKRSPS